MNVWIVIMMGVGIWHLPEYIIEDPIISGILGVALVLMALGTYANYKEGKISKKDRSLLMAKFVAFCIMMSAFDCFLSNFS